LTPYSGEQRGLEGLHVRLSLRVVPVDALLDVAGDAGR
jgi:hypothetical protein